MADFASSRARRDLVLAGPLALLGLVTVAAVPAHADSLPTPECVETLRTARIEAANGQVTDPEQPSAPGLTSYLAASATTTTERQRLLRALQERRNAQEAHEEKATPRQTAELITTIVDLKPPCDRFVSL